jgi:hypothetical protein
MDREGILKYLQDQCERLEASIGEGTMDIILNDCGINRD